MYKDLLAALILIGPTLIFIAVLLQLTIQSKRPGRPY
jgi:hypothetical protein